MIKKIEIINLNLVSSFKNHERFYPDIPKEDYDLVEFYELDIEMFLKYLKLEHLNSKGIIIFIKYKNFMKYLDMNSSTIYGMILEIEFTKHILKLFEKYRGYTTLSSLNLV